MNIAHATAFLYSLDPKGIHFGLENTREVLERLGHPERLFRTAHIAGSNGKGSTAAFLESLLRQTGLKVGLYTSPHLTHFRERFRVDGRPVRDEDIGTLLDVVLRDGLGINPAEVTAWIDQKDVVRRMEDETWLAERGQQHEFCRLTFFELTTVLSFLLFARAGVEIGVIEVGMGGRLDATNVIVPEVSAITPIHLEHTAWLGTTLGAIAGEKAGIIKPGVPVVIGRQHPEARAVFERVAAEQKSPASWLGEQFQGVGPWHDARFRIAGQGIGPVELGLVGAHQVDNAAVALACLSHLGNRTWPLDSVRVRAGLKQAFWPGRFERFGENGEWILDGAHNPDGILACAEAIRSVLGATPVRLVFGVLGDKDAGPMARTLEPLCSEVHLVRPRDARRRDPSTLVGYFERPVQLHASVPEALAALAGQTGGPIVITGSLTVVGEARAWLFARGLLPTNTPNAPY